MEDMTRAAAPPPPGGLLERLLDEAEAVPPSSPSVAAPSLAEVTAPIGEAVSAEAPFADPSSAGGTPVGGAPLGGGGGIPPGALLGNPAVLSALPALMENLSPLLSGLGKGGGSAPSAVRPRGTDRHTALLCALKPYLSPHRRETAETVIRLCKVWDALERSGIDLTGLLGALGGGSSQERGNGHVQ